MRWALRRVVVAAMLNQANTNRMTSVASIEAGSRWAMGHGHGFKDRSTAVLAIS
jgi:hypothetical protein